MTIATREQLHTDTNNWPVFLCILALSLPLLLWPLGPNNIDGPKAALVVVITGLGLVTTMVRGSLANTSWIWRWSMPILAIYAAMIPLGISPLAEGVKTFITLFLVVGWIAFLSSVDWTERDLLKLWRFLQGVILFNWLAYPILANSFEYAGTTPHKNTLGSLCLISVYILTLLRSRATRHIPATGRIWYIVPIALTLVAHSRGPLVALGSAAVVYALWPTLTKSKSVFVLAMPAVIGITLWGCYVYTTLDTYPWFQSAQEWMYEHTHQNIYSGRNIVWPILFDAIGQHPLFGYGAGARPNFFLFENSLDVTWSAHNLYYTIIIQVGYVGLGAFLLFLTSIWSKLYPGRGKGETKASAAFFAGLCIYQAFECMLTQNNLDSGLFLWLIPALGLTRATIDRQPTTTETPLTPA